MSTSSPRCNPNIILIIFWLLSATLVQAQITITHNVGNTPIETDMYSCERDEGWSRVFELSNFGIAPDEQFYITSGQVGLSRSSSGARLYLTVYSIDEDFPEFFHSLYPRTTLGTRALGQAPDIKGPPELVTVDFEEPIIVPAGTRRILVTVHKVVDIYHPESSEVYIAGTEEDTGESWYTGCPNTLPLQRTTELETPVPDANFYINVTGNTVSIQGDGSNTRLSHNVCDDIIETDIHSCKSSYVYWARAFTLSDFGIGTDESFTIRSGQVGITKTGWLPEVRFNIYRIDENFPASFSETDLIGSSQFQRLSPNIDRNPHIIEVQFDTPVVVPAGVERILVEVHKGIVYGDGVAFIAGSSHDTDVSWQRGCLTGGPHTTDYVSTEDFGKPDANFYINVTGDVKHTVNAFNMEISNICSEFLKEFRLSDESQVATVTWNFGDPNSGIDNTSQELSPFHDFSADGQYTIRAIVTANDGSIEHLEETIDVREPPEAHGIADLYACEDEANSGISSAFDVSEIRNMVLMGQTDKVVTFIDGAGNSYSTLPNPFQNSVPGRETIKVRVAHKDYPCCYSETSFDLVVIPVPDIPEILDLTACDTGTDGFASFDLEGIVSELQNKLPGMDFLFSRVSGEIIQPPYSGILNLKPWEEVIDLMVTDPSSGCSSSSSFRLRVGETPIAYPLDVILGCDADNDGISEYFDTSDVVTAVRGEQTDVIITYYNQESTLLGSSLPNPYTNQIPFEEIITVRVTDSQSGCYAETPLVLKTSTQPAINTPPPLYVCDTGDGIGLFDTSSWEALIIGNQPGLKVNFIDENGQVLPNPLPDIYQISNPWNESLLVTVESLQSGQCISETLMDLVVLAKPTIDLDAEYVLCHLEPTLNLQVPDTADYYRWTANDGSLVSEGPSAQLGIEGSYILTVGKSTNGIYCENSREFKLHRSQPPSISSVDYQGLSENNTIEIYAKGDGDFEYSIDGTSFQDSPLFTNVPGGVYTVQVRDKNGCGMDSRKVVIVDYPKFFTPNGDGYNDLWQVIGIAEYPQGKISIFDRYGRFLMELNASDAGWNGRINGREMPESDYWFIARLNTEMDFTGHFSLKR